MKRCYRLKKRFQYNYVYKHAESVADGNLVLLFCKSNRETSQAGFSVSKKYGHAVVRNRIRRQLKAAASAFMPVLKGGYNLIFVPRKTKYNYAQLVSSMEKLLRKAGLLNEAASQA